MAKGSLTVYSYSGCSTCRNAIAWLKQHAVAFAEKPIYTDPPSVPELRRMLAFQDGNLRKLFNTSGMVYRELGLAAKLPKMTEDEALALLASNGRLVKRPFALAKEIGLVGFDPKAWSVLT
ncbi:arsenate reductase family protein [Opitutaceae bacterium]